MKKVFKILRTHAGKTGHVSVTNGVYSEGNVIKWDSKIEIDGEWYDIDDHFDTHEYKHLIQGVVVTGVVSKSYGDESYHAIKSGTIRWKNNILGDCVKVLWCDSYNPLNKSQIGDAFEYGIELDLSKVDPRSLYKIEKRIGFKGKVKEKYNIEELTNFKILWHQGIDFKNITT